MAKRLSVEEAKVRVIDSINLLKDAESANVEKYMDKYAALRELEGDAREEAYKDICFALFGAYRDEDSSAEEGEADQEEEAEEEAQKEEESPQVAIDQLDFEPASPTVEPRAKLGEVVLALPPKEEIVPVERPVATKGFIDRLLSVWDGIAATWETVWEMYLAPLATLLLSLMGIMWRAARKGAILARTGAIKAIPIIGASLIHLWGAVAVMALLGAKMGIYGARASIIAAKRVFRVSAKAASLAIMAAAVAREALSQGWAMREELVNEWREEAA